MRLDKYLKLSGLIPRRTVAKEACDAGRVRLDGKAAKAADEVRVGMRLEFNLGRGATAVEILQIPPGQLSRTERSQVYRMLPEESS